MMKTLHYRTLGKKLKSHFIETKFKKYKNFASIKKEPFSINLTLT